MSLGGKQTSTQSMPPWMQAAAQDNIARAADISRIGYVPYQGPDVAALTPQQIAAMNNTNATAQAFGMGGGDLALPQATQYAGGVSGYSSYPMYQNAVNAIDPEQRGQIDGLFGAPVVEPAMVGQGFNQGYVGNSIDQPNGGADPWDPAITSQGTFRGTGIFDGDGFITDITGGQGLNNARDGGGGGGSK